VSCCVLCAVCGLLRLLLTSLLTLVFSSSRYGVWGDWSSPFITLQPAYEAAQLGVFAGMLLNGHIYRGLKPVHWSPSSRTALAESELEYPEGHKSRSIYVVMPLDQVGRCRQHQAT
jgi:isoleucyl-tRNA synthetase